jgi:signal transduction histidine kinase
MNLKFRFVILFTSFVAVVLALSMTVIYVLYYNYRIEDYYRRVQREASNVYSEFTSTNAAEKKILRLMENKQTNVLYEAEVIIADSNFNVIYNEPDSAKIKIDTSLFAQFRKSNQYRFQNGFRECVGMYKPNTKYYVMASAFDKYGIRKLSNLKIILLSVFAGGLLLTGFMSFFFVQQLMKPLARLTAQMRKTTEQNMTERVYEGKGNDEVAQIAHSFNAMLQRLEKAFELQKSFVHHASHELRTPLATMLSQTEAALNKELTAEEYKNTLLSLKEDQQEVIELTNSLLLLSQYEKISYSSDWQLLRIDEILYDTIDAAKKMLPKANISFEFLTIPEEEFLIKRCSEPLLRSAFRNLIKNAYTYSDDGSVNISIEANQNKIMVSFFNKGKQLTIDEQERLFIPFFRGVNSINKRGYGVGLSIVQRIAEVHKGNITYTAMPNNINKFIFEL